MVDFDECHRRTGLRTGWQWQLGALRDPIQQKIELNYVQVSILLQAYLLLNYWLNVKVRSDDFFLLNCTSALRSLLLTWLNLLSNVRKLPFLGIYVVMFSDVTVTFLKFSIIVVLFIVAFALGFHTLIAEKVCL